MLQRAAGGYLFLEGGEPYSSGVVADAAHEIVRVTLARSLPWRTGFAAVERFLSEEGRPRGALCGIELRSPRPLSLAGFAAFNKEYRAALEDWGLFLERRNPVARTNVVPLEAAPDVTELFAFSYTRPTVSDGDTRSFLTAGAGELEADALAEDAIVRPGETSAEAMAEKARHVVGTIGARLRALGADWEAVTATTLYTIHPIDALVRAVLLSEVGPASVRGLHWFLARPPVEDLEFEMDARGIGTERVLPLSAEAG